MNPTWTYQQQQQQPLQSLHINLLVKIQLFLQTKIDYNLDQRPHTHTTIDFILISLFFKNMDLNLI
jgi:hypothetical protein